MMPQSKGYKKRKTLGITEDAFSALAKLSKELEKSMGFRVTQNDAILYLIKQYANNNE